MSAVLFIPFTRIASGVLIAVGKFVQRGRYMCDLYEVKRGFILAPQSLHNQGQRLRLMIEDFDRLQKRFEGELEIFFSKNGGFIICFPIDMDAEELFDDTNYLAGYLDVTPHIIDLARAA